MMEQNKIEKRKRRVFNRLELIETSIVGIPAYPDAHMSFIKELARKAMTTHGSTRQLEERENKIDTNNNTMEEQKMPEEEQTPEESSEAPVEAPVEEAEAPAKVAEEKATEEVAEPVAEKSEDKVADFKAAIKDAFIEAAKEISASRGLTKADEEEENEDKKLDAGQLAVKYHIFSSAYK